MRILKAFQELKMILKKKRKKGEQQNSLSFKSALLESEFFQRYFSKYLYSGVRLPCQRITAFLITSGSPESSNDPS